MKQVKAIFFDVDSTIYTHKVHDIPASTKEALIELKKSGYKVAIATSRCRYEVKNLPSFIREFDFDAKIFDGGAIVMEHDSVIDTHPIMPSQVKKLVETSNTYGFAMRYSTFDKDYYDHECGAFIKDQFFKLYLNMPIVKAYGGEEVFNMLAYPQNQEQIDDIHQNLDGCSIVKHGSGTLEITAHGIDKSIGVKKLANHWNILMEEVLCFGDGANDVAMLHEAGCGIAMGNGNPKAKEAADIVCGHIDEDGLYKVCKELKLL